MCQDNTYFIPKLASPAARISLKVLYCSMAFACMVLFITGIAETITIYVAASVIVALVMTCCGCIGSQCYDRYYRKKHSIYSFKNHYEPNKSDNSQSPKNKYPVEGSV